MLFLSSVRGNVFGITDTEDDIEEFYSVNDILRFLKLGVVIHGSCIARSMHYSCLIEYDKRLPKYNGRTESGTYEDYHKGKGLTYDERIQFAVSELEQILGSMTSIDHLIRNIIKNADFEYDDCYKKYEGMLVFVVKKNSNKLCWYVRED